MTAEELGALVSEAAGQAAKEAAMQAAAAVKTHRVERTGTPPTPEPKKIADADWSLAGIRAMGEQGIADLVAPHVADGQVIGRDGRAIKRGTLD